MYLFERPGSAQNDNEVAPDAAASLPDSRPEQEQQLDQESRRLLFHADREIEQLVRETQGVSGDMTIALTELDDAGTKVAEHSFKLEALRMALGGTDKVPAFKRWNLSLTTLEGGEWEPYKYYGTHSLVSDNNVFNFRFVQGDVDQRAPFSIINGDKR